MADGTFPVGDATNTQRKPKGGEAEEKHLESCVLHLNFGPPDAFQTPPVLLFHVLIMLSQYQCLETTNKQND